VTKKRGTSGSKAGAKARKKLKLKKATLKDLDSSKSSKVRGGFGTPTLTCVLACTGRCQSVLKACTKGCPVP
jgi:hypothetical protein